MEPGYIAQLGAKLYYKEYGKTDIVGQVRTYLHIIIYIMVIIKISILYNISGVVVVEHSDREARERDSTPQAELSDNRVRTGTVTLGTG
jgi:hypothetical protein